MSLPELFLPVLRPVASLLSLFYLYAYSTATHGHLLAPFFYVASTFTFGCSLSYTLSYLRLTFLGLTKKELRCIELEGDPEKRPKGPDLVRGLQNMLRFYFLNARDLQMSLYRCSRSELQREFSSNQIQFNMGSKARELESVETLDEERTNRASNN